MEGFLASAWFVVGLGRAQTPRIHNKRPACRLSYRLATSPSLVVPRPNDRADAAILGKQRIAAVAEKIEIERFIRLLLTVAVDDEGAKVSVPDLAT
jgi:hypothetical protein